MQFKEIIYEKKNGISWITINRPEKYNAFTALTLDEMNRALEDSWTDRSIGVVVITGAGDKAFCTGGDQSARDQEGYARAESGFSFLELHEKLLYLIRNIPKPVIAMVNGYAIGGGHVLHMVCDLTIASEEAKFGQAGPRVGSYDAGFGSAYMARIIGQKRSREMWYLCRQYSAQEAYEMGLVNKVVPRDRLREEVELWCKEILDKSPYAIAMLKASFNADTDNIYGINTMAMRSLELYYTTDESAEGVAAFFEKRKPDFSRFRR